MIFSYHDILGYLQLWPTYFKNKIELKDWVSAKVPEKTLKTVY